MPAPRLPEGFERLAGDWDALANRSRASPFVRPDWIAAWWKAFGAGRLELLTHRGRGELEAVLPVNFRHALALSPCNWHSPEFGMVCADERAAGALFEALFSRRPQLVSLRLLNASDSIVKTVAAAAEAAHYHPTVRAQVQSPIALLEGDWDSYERGLSRNLRQDLRRCHRRLAEIGPVSLEASDSADELEAAFALEALGWKGKGGTAMASTPQTRSFYQAIARWAETRGWLRILYLRAGPRRVAFHLAFEHDEMYVPLKGGFDPAVSDCSPGKLMLQATFERAFEVGLRRYEFLGGGEEYKLRWATGTTDRLHFRAFAPTVRGASLRVADARGRPLVRRAITMARTVRAP